MAMNKEVYVKKDSNSSTIAPSGIYAIDFQSEAELSAYLPFNKLRIFNESGEKIYVFLDNYGDGSKPDYIIGAGLGVDEGVLEGVQYNTIFIQNKDASATIQADEIKTRISKVEES